MEHQRTDGRDPKIISLRSRRTYHRLTHDGRKAALHELSQQAAGLSSHLSLGGEPSPLAAFVTAPRSGTGQDGSEGDGQRNCRVGPP
jgi:hypothetical protein